MSTAPITSPNDVPALDPSLEARLRHAALRLRVYTALNGLAFVLAFLFSAGLIQLTLDYLVRGLEWSMRAALLVAGVAGASWIAWRRVFSPLLIRVTLADAAKLVERRYPQLASLLVSGVRFSRGQVGPTSANSPALMAVVVDEAGRKCAGLDFLSVLNPRPARRAALASFLLVASTAACCALRPDLAGMWLARSVFLREVPWPRLTTLVVDMGNGELIGARGDDLVIEARAEGVQPRAVELFFETASGRRGRETMTTIGSRGNYRYRYEFTNAQEDFRFQLEGGDHRTQWFQARLRDRPRVVAAGVRVEPPAYTRLEAIALGPEQRQANVLMGSRVDIRVTTNHEVTAAKLMHGRTVAADAVADEETGWLRFSLVADESRTFEVYLRDPFGLENKNPARFSLQVARDDAPRVRMKMPGVGDMVTPEAILPIEVEFADEYGLAGADIVYQVSRTGEKEFVLRPSSFVPYATSITDSLRFSVGSVEAVPGDRLSFFVRASDFDDVSGPNVAQSPEINLRVVTRDEFLAELARREQELRMDFERLVDLQEKLRGRLLSLAASSDGQTNVTVLAEAAASLERNQRNIAASANVIRQQFERILDELRVNQLETMTARRRLGDGIVAPLRELVRRELPRAADLIRSWAQSGSAETRSAVDPQQVTVLARMRRILANMLQWEGYQEAVNMLRDILRLQEELNRESQEAAQQSGADIFEEKPPD